MHPPHVFELWKGLVGMHWHEASLDELRRTLNSLQTSEVPNDMVGLLMQVWDDLDGGRDHGMQAYKLDRATGLRWDDPVLTFTIERHGGIVLGSTRAEIQEWNVDLAEATAEASVVGQRQVRARGEAVTSQELHLVACEITAAVAAGANYRLFSYTAKGFVRVHVGEIIGDGPAQTLEGRRKRLRAALVAEMEKIGWVYRGHATYGPGEALSPSGGENALRY